MQPEATTSFRSVLRNYIKAEPEKKAKYILGNFAVFISIVDSCEHSLKRTIKAERRYNRKSALGDVGIRVQNSHMGDPYIETDGAESAVTVSHIREELTGYCR